MAGEVFDQDYVQSIAVELGDGFGVAELQLKQNETAWNPLSTKGPLRGKMAVKYLIHSSGITVGLYAADECIGTNQIKKAGADYFESVQCKAKLTDPRATRCEDHQL
jgi:hypothetical protein